MKYLMLTALLLVYLTPCLSQPDSLIHTRLTCDPGGLDFFHLTEENGLSSHITYDVLKDRYGFIWIATDFGLDRFNGIETLSFSSNGKDSLSLPNAFINSLYEDNSGRLWICTDNGLSRYHAGQRTFTTFYPVEAEGFSADNVIHAVHEDHEHTLWVFTGAGLYSFDPDQQLFRSYTGYGIDPGYPADYKIQIHNYNTSRRFAEDRDRNIWIGTTVNGLFRIHPDRSTVDHFIPATADQSGMPDRYIRDVAIDDQGGLWVATGSSGIYHLADDMPVRFEKFDPADGKQDVAEYIQVIHMGSEGALWGFSGAGVVEIDQGSDQVKYHEFPDDQGSLMIYGNVHEDSLHLWFATSRGLYRVEKGTGRLTRYTEQTKGEGASVEEEQTAHEGLLRNACYSIEPDDEGGLWINHRFPGLDRVISKVQPIKTLKPDVSRPGNIISYHIPFVDSRNRLWISRRGTGSYRYEIKDGGVVSELDRYQHRDGIQSSLSSDEIIDMYEDRSGVLWITTTNGLNKYDPASNSFKRYFYSEVNQVSVAPLYQDSRGVYWMGIDDRLAVFDPGRGSYDQVRLLSVDSIEFHELWIIDLLEDSSGGLWIGTGRQGLLLLDRETDLCRVFHTDPDDRTSLASNNISALLEDRAGRLWVGTEHGLSLLDRETMSFSNYGKETGFLDEMIFDIEEDGSGNLWLSTRKGLVRFNHADSSVLNLDHSDGLANKGFIFKCFRSPETGRLYFGGPAGVDYFHPDQVEPNPYIPPVYITDVYINNAPLRTRHPAGHPFFLELSHYQNDIGFEFVALNYTQSEKNRYAYTLEGYDDGWIPSGDKRQARYTNLDPGTYTFRVKASNNSGVWNQEGTRLRLLIRPPWWQTRLALISYVLLLLLLVYGYNRLRTWKLRKDKHELEKQVDARTRDIQQQKEEILSANDELEQQKEELRTINEELQDTLARLQKAQKQLIIAEKMAALGELVAGVAHEINTPVGICITASSSLLNETGEMEEKYRKNEISRSTFREFLQSANQTARLILSNMERTSAMVQSFKQVSVDQSTEQKREFQVKAYLKDLIMSLYPKLKGNKTRINLECDESISINSYPGAFAQIITNLVINSMTHGFKNRPGKIDIKASWHNDQLNIIYRDDGEGIAPDVLPRIFDPFYTTDHKAGTGLGLNIVYNLVTQKMGGAILCESEEGEGVTFDIRIPGT